MSSDYEYSDEDVDYYDDEEDMMDTQEDDGGHTGNPLTLRINVRARLISYQNPLRRTMIWTTTMTSVWR